MPTGPIAYAAVADLFSPTAGYLANPSPTQNSQIAQTLLNMASRFIDEKCGRFFYNDGFYRRFFDGDASREITLPGPDLFCAWGTIAACSGGALSLSLTPGPFSPAPAAGMQLSLDIGANYELVTLSNVGALNAGAYPLTLSAGTTFAHPASTIANSLFLQFAYYENQPLSQWLTVQGDGLTGGATNYYLWPTNPKPYISTIIAGQTIAVQTPWQGINMPLIPVSNTSYLPTPRPGTATIAVTGNWGWPAVPDLIRDLTLKLAARAWEHRQSGWQSESADGQVAGGLNMSHHFDTRDEELLTSSGYVRWAV